MNDSDTLILQVTERIRETPDTVSFVVQPSGKVPAYRAGQFLTLLFDDELGTKPVRRSYSFATTPGVDPQWMFTVKKKPNGLVSRYLHDHIEVGDLLRSLPPAGQFVLPPADGPRDLFLIAGGSGITPLFSILKEALYNEPDCRILLLYANRSEDHIIYRDAIRMLHRVYRERFELIHLLSNPRSDLLTLRQALEPAEVYWGRLSNHMVEKWVDDYSVNDSARAHFFLCGPRGMMLKANNALGYKGFGSDQVHTENFVIKEALRPSAEDFPPAVVELERRGEHYEVAITPGQTILEAAEAMGLSLPFSCRAGTCATCSGRCTEGQAVMYTQDGRMDTVSTKGLVFTCVAYPQTKYLRVIMD